MATPVEIVRPKITGKEWVSMLLSRVMTVLVAGWILMLLLPLWGFYPGYWQTVAGFYIVQILTYHSNYRLWTKERK